MNLYVTTTEDEKQKEIELVADALHGILVLLQLTCSGVVSIVSCCNSENAIIVP